MKQFARNGGNTRLEMRRAGNNTERVIGLISGSNTISASLTAYVQGANISGNQIAYYSTSGLTGDSTLIYGGAGTISGSRIYTSYTGTSSYNELTSKQYVDDLVSQNNSQSGSSAILTGGVNSVAVYSTSASLSGYSSLKYEQQSGLSIQNNVQSYTSTASSSSVAFGISTTASNNSFAFGNSSLASGLGSWAVGLSAHATAESSISLGDGTTASAQWATSIGTNNLASGQKSIALGHRSKSSRTSQLSLANNGIGGVIGANQFGIITQHVQTTNSVATMIAYEPNQYTMLLDNNTIYNMYIQVVAKSTGGIPEYGVWSFRSAVRRLANASTTLIISNNRFADLVPSGMDCNISVDTTNGALNIDATGKSGTTFNWSATIMFTEVHT